MASNDMNKVILLGNIGKDPVLHHFGADNEKPIVKFSMATNNRYKNKQTGEYEDDTTWHNVVIFNKHWCDLVMAKAKVGTRILVEGEIKTRRFRKEGDTEDRWMTEIVLPMFGGEVKLQGRTKDGEEAGSSANRGESNAGFDDDIPFG